MGLRSSLLFLERRFAWSLLAFLTGTLFGVATLYYGLHERRPSISVQVVSQFDILDVRQPLQDLAILFQGNDIQRSNQNLRTLHVQFTNDGEADLLQSQYDQSETWGLMLRGGRILKVQLLDASSSYIRANLAPQLAADTVVTLNKLILERGRHFTLDLLVLHPKNTTPSVFVTGKIVGVDSIPVRPATSAGTQLSVWSRALSGSAWTQLVRLVVYFVAGLLVAIALTASGTGASSFFTNRARRRRAKEIRLVLETSSPEEVLARDILEHVYSVTGATGLLAARRLIKDGKLLSEGPWSARLSAAMEGVKLSDVVISTTAAVATQEADDYVPPARAHFNIDSSDPRSPTFAFDIADRLREARLVSRKGGADRVDPAFEKLLSRSIKRLVPDQPPAAEEAATPGE